MIPSLNYALLTNILHAFKDGNISHCEALGFTFDEMKALNGLSLDEFFLLSQGSVHFMTITVHHDILRLLLASSQQKFLRQQQINRAIRLGGSIALLNRYFGLTSNDVSLRRRLLDVSIPYGRTPVPNEEMDAKIWRQWQKCRVENLESSDALEAIMQVTEKLSAQPNSPSLTVVWNRIALCEQEAASRRARHAG